MNGSKDSILHISELDTNFLNVCSSGNVIIGASTKILICFTYTPTDILMHVLHLFIYTEIEYVLAETELIADVVILLITEPLLVRPLTCNYEILTIK